MVLSNRAGGRQASSCKAWAALWLASVSGCKSTEPSGASSSDRASAQASHSSKPASSAASVDPGEQAARAVFNAWVAAQNDGAFDTYATLYASPFVGVKRVGAHSFRFNRRGWLADRRSMFAAGAQVRVSGVTITPSSQHWVVAFKQTFESPAYRDTGRKLLALTQTPQGLRIAREEMLSSRVEGGGGSTQDLPGFFAAVDDAIVLRTSIDDRWLVPERLKLSRLVREPPAPDDPAYFEVPEEGPLLPREVVLPPEVRAMKGKRVFVTVAPEQPSKPLPPPCESTIVDIVLANAAKPGFESVRGVLRYDRVYGIYVRGMLDPPCPRGLWASETPPHTQYLPRPLSGKPLAEAVRAFRAQPEHAALQSAFLREPEASGNWYRLSPAAFELGPSDGALVFVSAYRYPTAELAGLSLSVLFERSAVAPQLRRVGLVDQGGFKLEPRLAFDLQGDGQLELLTAPSGEDDNVDVFFRKGGVLDRTTVYFTPDFLCPG